MFFTTAQTLERMRRQLAAMRSLVDSSDGSLFAESKISAWTPSEHLDHTVKVTASIVNRILQADASRVDAPLQFLGRLILMFGRIPRGRGRAPERLRGARVNVEELHAGITRLEGKLDELTGALLENTRGPIVPHPRFGGLNPSQALRFATVHADHHLRIIKDIRNG